MTGQGWGVERPGWRRDGCGGGGSCCRNSDTSTAPSLRASPWQPQGAFEGVFFCYSPHYFISFCLCAFFHSGANIVFFSFASFSNALAISYRDIHNAFWSLSPPPSSFLILPLLWNPVFFPTAPSHFLVLLGRLFCDPLTWISVTNY